MELYSEPGVDQRLVLQDRIALRLGRMAMRIAAVETMTRWYLLRILDIQEDEEERIEPIVGELSFRKLRAALVAAVRGDARSSTGKGLATLRSIMGRIARLEERRNVLTHSSWNYSRLPNEMLREKRHVSAGGVIRSENEAFRDLADLDTLVSELDEVGGDLSHWYMEHYLGMSPSAS